MITRGSAGLDIWGVLLIDPLDCESASGFPDRGLPDQTTDIHEQSTDHVSLAFLSILRLGTYFGGLLEYVNLSLLGLDQDHWRSWARQG
jgi:hypothetical protein